MSESDGVLLGGVRKNSPSPSGGEEPRSVFSVGETEVKEDQPLYRRHKRAFTCGGICACFVVLLGIVILVLALVVFKAKQPVIHIDSITLETLSISGGNSSENLSGTSVNLTLGVGVSVYNPNHASFKYTNSTSYMYYREMELGEAPIPAGQIGAKGTETLSTILKLNASRVLTNPNLLSDYLAGSFPITTSAEVSGRVNVLNVFKRHAKSFSLCSLSIVVSTRSVENMTCTNHLKF